MKYTEWQPPYRYKHNDTLWKLLFKVKNWQENHQAIADGIIGPYTWDKKDNDLITLAKAILNEIEKDEKAQQGYLYLFLKRALENHGPSHTHQ